jgi:uncharacterized lipoprotein
LIATSDLATLDIATSEIAKRDMIMLQRDSRINDLLSTVSMSNFSMSTVKVLTLTALSVAALTGCDRLAISNGSMDYARAQSIAAVQVSDSQQTRQIAPLYPVPVIPKNSASEKMVLTNAKGNRYVLPKPIPLDQAKVAEIQIEGAPSAPQLVMDGNGFPLLKIDGDSTKIWDAINRSLIVANVNVTQRNAATNRFMLTIDNVPYQLRLGRIGSTTTVTLQKPDETLADNAIATDLLERIARNWAAS